MCALGLILVLNLQSPDATTARSGRAYRIVTAIMDVDSALLQLHIRKLGHTLEYFLLGIASYAAFGWYGVPVDGAISLLDQFFKILLPTRHFDITDLPYDAAGYLLGCCACWAGKKILSKIMIRDL